MRGLQVNFFFSIFHDQFYVFPRHLKKLNANTFLTGSGTTCWTHISWSVSRFPILLLRSDFVSINYSNWASHGETYLAKCQAKGITPHPHAAAHSEKPSDEHMEQQTIEDFLKLVLKWS